MRGVCEFSIVLKVGAHTLGNFFFGNFPLTNTKKMKNYVYNSPIDYTCQRYTFTYCFYYYKKVKNNKKSKKYLKNYPQEAL